jgi:adenine phosphoribosyltransferase
MAVKEKLSIEERIKSVIRDVPDFPKQGIIFKDITPILANPILCEEIEEEFLIKFDEMDIDAIAGIESRGFLFGMSLAKQLSVPFIPVRKKGKLPYKTIAYEYELEYGASIIEMHTDAIEKGMKVLIHDDLLATGGTAAATAELVKMQNATVAGFAFIVELDFLDGRKMLDKYKGDIISLAHYTI